MLDISIKFLTADYFTLKLDHSANTSHVISQQKTLEYHDIAFVCICNGADVQDVAWWQRYTAIPPFPPPYPDSGYAFTPSNNQRTFALNYTLYVYVVTGQFEQ